MALMARGALVALVLTSVVGVHAFGSAPVSVRDIDGHTWTPLSPREGETNLVLFLGVDCPISARYAPEIGRIADAYTAKGVHTFFVFPDAGVTDAAVRKHLRDFYPALTVPAIVDRTFAITASVGANVTPEAAVYTAAGRVYRGRVDDLYVSLGQNRQAPTVHDLRLALDAAIAGKPAPHATTNAVGCFIERPHDK
jgi:hypothetical protein